jgi:hypothetical protein
VPSELGPVILRNKRLGYKILFDAAAKTLKTIAADPERLGAQIAVTAVLHTWGQNLLFHPHLHCVVTGGGLSCDQNRWVDGGEQYFLPVRVLAKMFRGKFLAALDAAYSDDRLYLGGDIAELANSGRWARLRDQLYQKNWVVYAKPPFGGPEQVFRYLGRYTHRVAISNHRLVRTDGRSVTFKVKDYADRGRTKQLTLSVERFLGRFLLHTLPKRFVRIRHYGLVAGRNVDSKLATARKLLGKNTPNCQRSEPRQLSWSELLHRLTGIDVMVCPGCGERLMRRRRILPDTRRSWANIPARASPHTTGEAA